MTIFADLFSIAEDQRIEAIGKSAEAALVGCLLERDQPEKVARYISKILSRFQVRHVDTVDGPTAGVVLVRFAPKVTQ